MKKLLIILWALILALPVNAQYIRSSYFMDASGERLSLNPALRPNRGFIQIPVIGGLNLDATTNLPSLDELYELLSEDGEITTDALMSKLKPVNSFDVNMNIAPVSFGFKAGKNFFTFGVNARTNINAAIPKTMFEFIEDISNSDMISGNRKYSITNEKLGLDLYSEVALGYSRTIGERLTVGGKVKVLLGMARLNLNVNKLEIDGYFPNENDFDYNDPDIYDELNEKVYAKISSDAELQISGKGFTISENEEGYISEVNIDNFGIGGFGAAIDLGVHFKLTDNIDLSASILDLGYLNWDEKYTTVYQSKANFEANDIEDLELFDFNILGFKNGMNQSMTSNLASTLVVGGEYRILKDKIGFGLLSTTRFGAEDTKSKLSAIITYRPTRGINASVSFSTLSGYNSLGASIKLGPLFVATDYILNFGENEEKYANAYLGISIPIGKKQ